MHMLLAVTAVGKASVTAFKFTFEIFSLTWVLLWILRFLEWTKIFLQPRVGARVVLLAHMHSNVVSQFSLRLEGLVLARELFPVADMAALLQAPHMFHGDMSHQLLHDAEGPVTAFPGPA